LPISEGAKAAATIPFMLVPAAFVYQEDIRELRRRGKENFNEIEIVYFPSP
jgi:hypothetical protein